MTRDFYEHAGVRIINADFRSVSRLKQDQLPLSEKTTLPLGGGAST